MACCHNIRRQILLKDLTNLQDLRHWASIAESTAAEEENQGEITTILKEVQHFIRNLAATETTSEASTRGRSSSVGRRVTFADEPNSTGSPEPRYWNPPAQQKEFVTPQQYIQPQQYQQNRPNQQFYAQPNQHSYQAPYQPQPYPPSQNYPRTYYSSNQAYNTTQPQYQQPTPGYSNPGYYTPQPQPQTNTTNNVPYSNFTPRPPNFYQRNQCSGCGGQPHARSQCPAFNVTCHTCGRLHHFSSVCRSGRRPQ